MGKEKWMAKPEAYARANMFLRLLKECACLTDQQKKTLRSQALAGDIEGARRGLEKLERGGDG